MPRIERGDYTIAGLVATSRELRRGMGNPIVQTHEGIVLYSQKVDGYKVYGIKPTDGYLAIVSVIGLDSKRRHEILSRILAGANAVEVDPKDAYQQSLSLRRIVAKG